jgi:hypothetical protein
MKIYRGPRSTKKWNETDTKTLTKWAQDWHPDKQLHLDGTIEKEGRRHTHLGIVFEAEDIAALHDAFQRHQRDRIHALEAREAELTESVKLLESALGKIGRLLHHNKAPTPTALLNAVKKIAHHFRWNHKRREPIDLDWINFNDI